MKNIYAIFDRIAQEIVGLRMYALMCFRTNQEAVRYFADAINDETSMLNKHPADYSLILVGELNDSGNIKALHNPELIITGDSIISLQKDEQQHVA